jgi:hypothetical protein
MTIRRGSGAFVCGVVVALAGRALADPPRYVGTAACASQNCHGSVTARGDSPRSLQNEYVTWYKEDRHAQAFAVLRSDRSRRIADLLGLREAPTEAKRCLDCHAVNVPKKAQGAKFRLEDGVGCEACHGPAGAWLERHTERGWTPARSVALGMRETTAPVVAAEVCLGCHLGSATKRVDHEMLAAGHPPLVFELDTFAANMPAHWAEHAENLPWFRGGAWSAGQVVAAREAALQFARQVREAGWPDFAAYDCQACHHEVGRDGGWRLRGRHGRPPLDPSRRPGMDALARVIAPGEREALRASAERLQEVAFEGRAGSDVDAAVADVRERTGRLLGTTALDEQRIATLVRAIVDAAEPTAALGFRAAQQAAWALDALVEARASLRRAAKQGADDAALRAAVGKVFDELQDPNAYDATRVAARLAVVGTALP